MINEKNRVDRLYRFLGRLSAFVEAANELDEAWEHLEGDLMASYPSYLPSFDEFCGDLAQMRDDTEDKIDLMITYPKK